MKKKIVYSILLIIVLSLLLCACGGSPSEQGPAGKEEASQLDFSNIVTVVSQPTAAPESAPAEATVPSGFQSSSVTTQAIDYEPAPTAPPVVYTPEPTAAPTPIPVEVPALNYVTITKSPLSETVAPGGTAVFTSYADNATSVNWIVASADRKTIYTLADAPNHFPGLQVSGVYSNVVTLSNIPAIMNGWEIQSYFEGNGGPKYSADAFIFVLPPTPGPIPGFVPGTGTMPSGDVPEAAVLQNVQKCVQAVKSYNYLGYTISEMENYNYTYDAATGGSASFNVSFSNSNYKIVCEFLASAAGYAPVSAAVFDTSWKVVQAYSFINNSTLEDLHTRVLCEYCK